MVGSGSGSVFHDTDPKIQIGIKMKRIRNPDWKSNNKYNLIVGSNYGGGRGRNQGGFPPQAHVPGFQGFPGLFACKPPLREAVGGGAKFLKRL